MEVETLYTASKWEILQYLGEEPLSPLEISEKASTKLANVSQQLRLLEMAGIVTSHRIPNRDKGQPRIKYSLANDQSYVIATADDFVQKKQLKLSKRNKAILKIWFLADENTRYVLEKAFWQYEPKLGQNTQVALGKTTNKSIELLTTGNKTENFLVEDLEGNNVKVSVKSCTTLPAGAQVLYA